jgi:hypothetical protein
MPTTTTKLSKNKTSRHRSTEVKRRRLVACHGQRFVSAAVYESTLLPKRASSHEQTVTEAPRAVQREPSQRNRIGRLTPEKLAKPGVVVKRLENAG